MQKAKLGLEYLLGGNFKTLVTDFSKEILTYKRLFIHFCKGGMGGRGEGGMWSNNHCVNTALGLGAV